MSKNVYFNDRKIPTKSYFNRLGSTYSKNTEEAIAKFLENINLVTSLTPEMKRRIRSDPSLLEVEERPSFSKYYIRLKEPEAVKEISSLEEIDDTPVEPVKKVDLGLLVESTIENARRDAQAKSFVHPPGEEDTFEEDAESDDEPYNVLGDSVAEKDAQDAIAEFQKDYDDLEIKDGGTRRNKKYKKRMTKKRKTRRSTQKKRKGTRKKENK